MTADGSVHKSLIGLAGATGLEPATSGVTGRRPKPKTVEFQRSLTLGSRSETPQRSEKCHGFCDFTGAQ